MRMPLLFIGLLCLLAASCSVDGGTASSTALSGGSSSPAGSSTATASSIGSTNVIRVYFLKPDGWNSAYIYLWSTVPAAANAGWPGTPMTRVSNDNWYGYSISNADSTSLIFNQGDSGNQSANLSTSAGGYFAYGQWFPSADAVTTNLEFSVSTNGRFRTISSFYSFKLQNMRDIRVYLPASYTNATNTNTFPVVYFHDGQNVFAPGGSFGCWNAETAYNGLVSAGKIREAILVGINNTADRNSEYTPTYDAAEGFGGKGSNYLAFVADELIPYMNLHFRTQTGPSNTALIGSSLGGLISFYSAWKRPEVFGMAGCMSSSFWWDSQSLLKEAAADTNAKRAVKFYLDSGNAEGSDIRDAGSPDEVAGNGVKYMAEDAHYIAHQLLAKGWVNEADLLFDIDYPAGHNEAAWASRVYLPLQFFLGGGPFTVTNISASLSLSQVTKSAPLPVMIFAKAYYQNGMIAEIPLLSNLVVSASAADSNLFRIESNLVYVQTAQVQTASTQITLNAAYGGFSTNLALIVLSN